MPLEGAPWSSHQVAMILPEAATGRELLEGCEIVSCQGDTLLVSWYIPNLMIYIYLIIYIYTHYSALYYG
jgi:hypothetical protein